MTNTSGFYIHFKVFINSDCIVKIESYFEAIRFQGWEASLFYSRSHNAAERIASSGVPGPELIKMANARP